jgi:hypothetical protein
MALLGAALLVPLLHGPAGASSLTVCKLTVTIESIDGRPVRREVDGKYEVPVSLKIVTSQPYCPQPEASPRRVRVTLEERAWLKLMPRGATVSVDQRKHTSLRHGYSEEWVLRLPPGTSYADAVGALEPPDAARERDRQQARLEAYLKKQTGPIQLREVQTQRSRGLVLPYDQDHPDVIPPSVYRGRHLTFVAVVYEGLVKNPDRIKENVTSTLPQIRLPALARPGWVVEAEPALTSDQLDGLVGGLEHKNGHWEGLLTIPVTGLHASRDIAYCRPRSGSPAAVCKAQVQQPQEIKMWVSFPVTLRPIDCKTTPRSKHCQPGDGDRPRSPH